MPSPEIVLGVAGSLKHIAQRILSPFPALEHKARRAMTYGRYFLRQRAESCRLSPGWTLQTPWQWAQCPPERIELFFGYYDKSPWSRSGKFMALHGLPFGDHSRVQIRIFDGARGGVATVGHSRAWNLQQGSMTQWLADSERIIFNDVAKQLLVSRIVDAYGHEEAVVPFPIQTLHPNGLDAISLNYKRLWKLRPEYGYSEAVQNFIPDQRLDQDGLWQVDLRSGTGRLMISIAQLFQIMPRPDMNPDRTKLNHAIASPSGKRFAFMHHWFNGPQKTSRLYSVDWNGDNLRLILDSGMVSHYHWLDDNQIVLYGNTPDFKEIYFHLNAIDGSFELIDHPGINQYGDGHPTYSPDRHWILTDSYPDRGFYQHLLLYHVKDRRLVEVGQFLHPPRHFGGSRCDLHPRWSPDGKRISFDSVWTGARGSYIVENGSVL